MTWFWIIAATLILFFVVESTGNAMDINSLASNPSTWPTGDKIWDISRAVALAEGFNVPGSVPARLHNPGDLSDGADTFGYENHSGSRVTTFPDDQTGWWWLYNKWANIAAGRSSVYSPDMTWNELAQHYAGAWQNWVANVTAELGVDPNSTLNGFLNS